MRQSTSGSAGKGFVAFDFGTHCSRIAFGRGEGSGLVTDLAGDARIPSVLALAPQGGLLAGHAARDHQALYPQHTLVSIKRLLSEMPVSLAARGPFFPHEVEPQEGAGLTRIEIGGALRSSIELQAQYLVTLRRSAELFLERAIDSAVLTVPVCFSPFERQAYSLAARMAGFQQVRLIDEATAAALAWIATGGRGRVAVCVWGAGYLNVAVARWQDRLVRVVACGGAAVGGDDLDLALARRLLALVQQGGALQNPHHVARHLLTVAEGLKRDIAARGKGEVNLSLGDGRPPIRAAFTAADLEQELAPLMAAAERVCSRVLADAGLEPGDLDALLLAGGMTRMASVASALSAIFGREPVAGVDPEECVVLGAMERARILDRDSEQLVVMDANSCALGLEGQAGAVSPFLDRLVHLPAGNRELFTTYLERQTDVAIELFGQMVGEWDALARVEIGGIPPMAAGAPSIEVTFVMDEDGQINVEAQEMTRSKRLTVELRPRRGLPSSMVRATLDALPAPLESAQFEGELSEELRQRGRFLLETIRELTRRQAGAMTRDEKQLLAKKLRELEEVLDGADLIEIRSCAQELEEAARPLIQRDIDAGLQAVLR